MRKSPHLIIIADDLTGSGDAGLFFASSSKSPSIVFYSQLASLKKISAPVILIDTESRFCPAREAARRQELVIKFLKKRLSGNFLIYKKIDSTLRGNIIAETKKILQNLPVRGKIPVIVAFPRQKRYTIGGWQYVGRTRLDKTPFALDPRNRLVTANVQQLFERIARAKFFVHDCQTQNQLKKIAKDIFQQMLKTQIAIGSAAVLEEIARIYYHQKINYPFISRKYRFLRPNLLLVNGSANPLSHQQIEFLQRKCLLPKNIFLTIISAPKEKSSPALVQKNILRLARQIIRQENITTIIIAGGETAFNLIKFLKIKSLKIIGAVEPGISIMSDGQFIFFLKPGGFGSKDILKKIIQLITRVGFLL